MDESQLREIANDFLVPFLAGTYLEARKRSSSRADHLVALEDPCRIVFKAAAEDKYRLILRRSQPFGKQRARMREIDVVRAFVTVVRRMEKGLQGTYRADLRAAFPRRVVTCSLCDNKNDQETVLSAFDQLDDWARRQYEGKPIAAALGFVGDKSNGAVSFLEMCKHDFSAVVSNGVDTVLTCNLKGEVLRHEALSAPERAPNYAPFRLSAIASWSDKSRIAIVLNRAGEILVFKNGALRFTRRGGRWHFLTHIPLIKQMGRLNEKVRKAVYSTCLDSSFARTGACIGVVTSSHLRKWQQVATEPADYVQNPKSTKAKAIAAMIKGRPFQELDRRLRQELVAIDGATLIDYRGNILAVGAILRIQGGSTGGGRLAAAKALSALGLGVKVSQDGGIRGYHNGNLEPKFLVM